MPVVDEERVPKGQPVAIRPSAPCELFWALHTLAVGPPYRAHPFLLSPQPELASRVRGFWRTEGPSFGELLVLAHAADLLFETALDELLDVLETGIDVPGELGMTSEPEADRQLYVERLHRLAREADLRRRYAHMVGEVWEHVRPAWESEGLPLVLDACRQLQGRLSGGVDSIAQLGPFRRGLLRDPYVSQALAAAERGELAVSPGYFTGKYLVWDFHDLYLVGVQAQPQDELAELRVRAERVTSRLKTLADPTRLAILAHLASSPSSISEVSRLFGLAQPTVSMHVRLLREAGLVEASREGARTAYRAARPHLERLLEEAGGTVFPRRR